MQIPEIPIPVRAAGRPVHQGMVVPYITLQVDGKVYWGQTRGVRLAECVAGRRCQLCGQHLGGRLVFLITPEQLADRFSREPALHPECAAYAQRACPMIAGRMTHYARTRRGHTGPCPEPGCGCGGWVSEGTDNQGRPADPWLAVWVTGYTVGIKDARVGLTAGNVNGCVLTSDPLKVRQVRGAGAVA